MDAIYLLLVAGLYLANLYLARGLARLGDGE